MIDQIKLIQTDIEQLRVLVEGAQTHLLRLLHFELGVGVVIVILQSVAIG